VTPQTAEINSQCKEDHHNTSAPPPAPQAAHSGESAAAPPALRVGVRRTIRIIERDSVNPETGEIHNILLAKRSNKEDVFGSLWPRC